MASEAKTDSWKPSPPDKFTEVSWKAFVPLIAVLTLTWAWHMALSKPEAPQVDYSVFYGWAEGGKVQSVDIQGLTIVGALKATETVSGASTSTFRTVRPDEDPALLPLLRDKDVAIHVTDEQQPFFVQALLAIAPWLLMIGFWVWMSRRATASMVNGGPMAEFLKSKGRRFERSKKVVTFDEVAGLHAAKRDLQEVVQFLKEPARFRRLGGKIPRGVLLVGPPGTGKTLLARAVAGESGVPFFSITASEFIEMFVGVGAARVRDLFAEAKKEAPSIVFIDELDAVGRSRGAGLGGGHDEREQPLNQLLSEMDGFDRNDLVIVMAATNRPDVLDPALLRPGRFDRHITIDRPERASRRAILGIHIKNKPLAPDVDLEPIAAQTAGFSGADLSNLVNEAALLATRRGAESIAAADFSEAYDKIVLGELRETTLDGAEKRRVAFHESGHTIVARFAPEAESPQRVTIIPRGMALGVTQQTPAEDRHLMTKAQLESRLSVFMGGFAAEQLVFGTVSSGAESDLKEATRLATKMVAQFGMSEAFGPVYYEHDVEHPFLGRKIASDGSTSDATTHAIEDETRRVLRHALVQATQLLESHRQELDRLARLLLDKETLEGEELKTALEPLPPGVAAPRMLPAAAGC